MKLKQHKKWLVLAFTLLNGFLAVAQSNNVPGAMDFSSFSYFITQRNIFDPSRFPRSSAARSNYRPKESRSAPAFTLVGTMHYEKGMFAFFDGNNSGLRKVLYQSDGQSIAGYTVTEITLKGARLQTADKKQTIWLKLGDMMRQEGSVWRLAAGGESFTSTMENSASMEGDVSSGAGAVPSSVSAPNDTLRKLKEQRAKELEN
jgi:hypothetical protein